MASHERKQKAFFRKKLLIYPRFQLTLIVINALLMMGAFGISLYQSSEVFNRFVKLGNSIQLAPDHPYFQMIKFQSNSLYSHLILAFLVAILTASFTTLILSH